MTPGEHPDPRDPAPEAPSDAPGWHRDPHGVVRWWDGERWTDLARQPPATSLPLLGGLVLLLVGVAVTRGASSDDVVRLLGWVLLAVGASLALVGAVAAGVRLGIQHVEWDRQRRSGRV